MESQKYIAEIIELLNKCKDTDLLEKIYELNLILASLSAAKLEYLIELSNLLFGQSTK